MNDNFITSGKEISASAYLADHDFDKTFVDRPIDPFSLPPIEKIDAPNASRILKFYSIAHNGFMIGGILCVAIMGLFASSAKDNSKDHLTFHLLLIALGLIGLSLIAKFVGTMRFRSTIVASALQNAFDDVKYDSHKEYLGPGFNTSKKKTPPPDFDLLNSHSLRECVKLLKIGGDKWNRGIVKNELNAAYHDMAFHYFDATMEYFHRVKYSLPTPCFIGQIYIFKCHVDKPLDVFILPESNADEPQNLSCYPDFFKTAFYTPKTDPFVTSVDTIKGMFKAEQSEPLEQTLQEPLGSPECIQSSEFMECMLQLRTLLKNKAWGVRVKNGYIILYLCTRKNKFEFSFGKADKAMKKLCDEVNEMRSIVGCFARYTRQSKEKTPQ